MAEAIVGQQNRIAEQTFQSSRIDERRIGVEPGADDKNGIFRCGIPGPGIPASTCRRPGSTRRPQRPPEYRSINETDVGEPIDNFGRGLRRLCGGAVGAPDRDRGHK